MYLPDYVRVCVDALEKAGFQAWAVGGCVRDAIFGLTPNDYDLCTDARPDQTEAVFAGYSLILNGKKHGTVGVILGKNVVEITTFRTEGDYRDNRHPEWVEFVPDIKQDLARRDFTVNAMAWSPKRGFADPFGGREDLKNHVLRAVGDPETRFREDSLRILRGARFAVKYRLEPEAATEKAMTALAPLMDNLARERVWDELCKLILLADASDLLRFAPVVTQVIPELRPLMGFDQKNKHHIYDIYTHTAQVVQGVPRELTLRWAALLHDIGKPASFTLGDDGQGHFYGHAAISAEIRERLQRAGFAPDYLQPVYQCEKCKDTGYTEFKMCECMRKELIMLGYKSSGLGSLLGKQRFDNFSLDYYQGNDRLTMEHILDCCRNYAETFGKNSGSLLFMGKTGLGKTHLSTAIAASVIERGYDVVYETAQNLISTFSNERFHSYGNVDKSGGSSRYFDCDLLIIDDFGTEETNQFSVACFYNLINTRSNNARPIIINTNLVREEIKNRYTDRIASRLGGEFTVFPFTGSDIRAQKLRK